MRTVDFVRTSLEMSTSWIMGLINDMRDAPTTAPTPNGGNHPLWVLGHSTYSEANLVYEMIEGQANPLESWKDIFGQGSQAVADAGHYPPFDEVLAKFEETRAHTLQVVESLSDDDLDKPSHAPEEMKQFFGTIATCLAAIPIHTAFHGGQVADARRAAGRPPLMG